MKKNSKTVNWRALSSVAALAIALHTSAAFAQANSPAGDEASSKDEIIVTASKSGAQNIQDVPLNISAVGTDQLEKSGSSTMDDIMRQVPGVNVSGAAGNKSIIIRGLAAQTGAAMVGLYLDEALLPPTGTYGVAQVDPRLVDIERVEVLRGPQGTLYGAGSVGGTVRYITKQPDLNDVKAAINVRAAARSSNGGGSYDGDIMFNLPLAKDKLGLRIVAWEGQVDGFQTNTGLKREHTDKETTYGGRAELLFQPTDTTKVTGTLHYQSIKLDDTSRVFVDGNYRSAPLLEPFNDKVWMGSLTLEQKVSFGTFTLTGSHIERSGVLNLDQSQFLTVADPVNRAAFLPARFNSYDLKYGTIYRDAIIKNNVGELRFTSDFRIPVQVTTGLFYNRSVGTLNVYGFFVDPGTGLPYGALPVWYETHGTSNSTNKAAFFNLNWSVTDRLSVEGGIRYYDLGRSNQIYIANPFFGLKTGYEPKNVSKHTGTVKRAQITFKPNSDILTYAVYSQGFREGGANTQLPGSVGIPRTFSPDFVDNFELGFKTELADRQLVLNGAVYHMDWKGIQVLQRDNTGAYSFTTNGGKAGFDGIELEARLSPQALPGFTLGLSGRYSKQKLAEDNPAVTPVAGLKGQAIPYSNKLGLAASVDQKFDLQGLSAYVHLDATYTGKGYTAFDPRDRFYRAIGDYAIINARFGVDEATWHASLYTKNLTNTRGYLTWTVEAFPGIPDRVNVTQPREVGIELGYKF